MDIFAKAIMLATLVGGFVGMIYGLVTYKEEETPSNILIFPGCDECAEYA